MKSNFYFCSSASIFWRVNRELFINLAGGRALLLELAHPLVAAGVAQHSSFQQNPFRRLWRTLTIMMQLTFGDAEKRRRALQAFQRCHVHVHGHLTRREGEFAAGAHYHANAAELKLWVLATLIDSALMGYETFVAPLALSEKKSYYEDCKPVAQLLGIPTRVMPRSYHDFEAYLAMMLHGEVLHVSAEARQIVTALLAPRLLAPAVKVARFFGVGLLPENLRRSYGFRWDHHEEERLQRYTACLRWLRRHLPNGVCLNPQALLAGGRAHDESFAPTKC